MTHEYHIIPRCFRWLRRFRKRCGYGVHSPLAFEFITGVIYNKEHYYAYESLRQPLVASISRADEYDPQSGLTAKDLRLLFRLTNYQAPATIALLGASPTVAAYITAARRTATIVADTQQAELVYCDLTTAGPALNVQRLEENNHPSSAIILRGIHRDAASRTLWQQLQQSPYSVLTFDLGRFGIVLNRPKINRQHYVVNYF